MRRIIVSFALALLAGCATAPPRGGGDFASALALCPGGGISNAPAADAHGRVSGYDPSLRVRGVTLARAPADACLSSGYGPRRGGASRFHHGVDLYTGAPRPALAAGDGIVISAGVQSGYGKVVALRHGSGVETRYAHLSAIAPGLAKGAQVRAGDVIGRTGETGNATAVHLHYEVRIDGRTVDPLGAGR